jgi:hypothetical protein
LSNCCVKCRQTGARTTPPLPRQARCCLPGKKREYLSGINDALAGADEARVVLEKAVKRLVETFGSDGPTT